MVTKSIILSEIQCAIWSWNEQYVICLKELMLMFIRTKDERQKAKVLQVLN
jgi:hypothetical protein